jgi:molecular chaperone GrpE (heat shock protein)
MPPVTPISASLSNSHLRLSGDMNGQANAPAADASAVLRGLGAPAGEKAKAKAAEADGGDSSDSFAVKALKKRIKELQKQLAQAQAEMERVRASSMSAEAKARAMASAQSRINSLAGALQTAMSELARELERSGSGAAGSLVDTRA